MGGVSALAIELPGPLVGTGWLAEHRDEVVVLDVREDATTYLGQTPPSDAKPDLKKLAGHIPGAISVPWKEVVAKGEEQGIVLKAMLPAPDAFARLMQASGVNSDSAVVIAGLGKTAKDQAYATRLYFTLKYFGHDNVALLDGGTAQWAMEGRPLAYTPEIAPQAGAFQAREKRTQLLVDTPEVEAAVASGRAQLVDCRTEDFFLGLTTQPEFVTPEHKGHLAGAKSLPFVLLSDNSGPARFFALDDIRRVAALKGIALDAPTIAYCNTGVTASLDWFTFHELLGNRQTRLYDGSMHAWSKVNPEHEVTALANLGEAQASTHAATEAAADEAATEVAEGAVQGFVLAPPRSLQTLADERRDLQRERRNALFDGYSVRHVWMPMGFAAQGQVRDRHEDRLRRFHREQRDAVQLQHDAWMDAMCPWSTPQRDWSRQRSFLRQMEQLDRQAWRDAYLYGAPFALAGPYPW
jgi:thiosulfate/3-mercaptopyruvate sulfurtransferase